MKASTSPRSWASYRAALAQATFLLDTVNGRLANVNTPLASSSRSGPDAVGDQRGTLLWRAYHGPPPLYLTHPTHSDLVAGRRPTAGRLYATGTPEHTGYAPAPERYTPEYSALEDHYTIKRRWCRGEWILLSALPNAGNPTLGYAEHAPSRSRCPRSNLASFSFTTIISARALMAPARW